jgi:hypothetical protein
MERRHHDINLGTVKALSMGESLDRFLLERSASPESQAWRAARVSRDGSFPVMPFGWFSMNINFVNCMQDRRT